MAIATFRKKERFQGQKVIEIPRSILAGQVVNNPVINQLYITELGYYPKAKFHYRERPHGADQYIIIFCMEGRGEAIIRKISYHIEPGDFFVIPAKAAHTYFADQKDPWTIYWVHFKGPSSEAIILLLYKQFNAPKGSIKYSGKIIELFNEMYSQLERGYSSDYLGYANICLWYYLATFIQSNQS